MNNFCLFKKSQLLPEQELAKSLNAVLTLIVTQTHELEERIKKAPKDRIIENRLKIMRKISEKIIVEFHKSIPKTEFGAMIIYDNENKFRDIKVEYALRNQIEEVDLGQICNALQLVAGTLTEAELEKGIEASRLKEQATYQDLIIKKIKENFKDKKKLKKFCENVEDLLNPLILDGQRIGPLPNNSRNVILQKKEIESLKTPSLHGNFSVEWIDKLAGALRKLANTLLHVKASESFKTLKKAAGEFKLTLKNSH